MSKGSGRWALIAAVSALALSGCRKGVEATATHLTDSGQRLTVASVQVADEKPLSGVVTTRDQSEARARIGGVLGQLLVREGDLVRKGQRIGLVTDDRLGLETAALDAQARALEAQSVRANQDLERTRALVEKGIYATARLDQDQAAATAADRSLEAARSQRAASAESVAQGAILAPADGRVLSAQTPAGSVVAAGQSIATVAVGLPVIRVAAPESQAAFFRLGAHVAIRGLAAEGQTIDGVIVEVYPKVVSGQVSADVRVPGLDTSLVGRRVEVLSPAGDHRAIVVPASFVFTRFGIDFVRVVGPDGQASDVPVQLASTRTGETREVLSGLKPDDVILAAGQ